MDILKNKIKNSMYFTCEFFSYKRKILLRENVGLSLNAKKEVN